MANATALAAAITVAKPTFEVSASTVMAESGNVAAFEFTLKDGFMKVEPQQPTKGGECNVGIWKYGNGRIDELTNEGNGGKSCLIAFPHFHIFILPYSHIAFGPCCFCNLQSQIDS